MKYILTLLFTAFALVHLSAQIAPDVKGDVSLPPTADPSPVDSPAPDAVGPDVNDSNEVFLFAEEMPMFPGGDSAWKSHVRSVMTYPPEALAAGMQGTVYVQFVVETDGSITGCIVRKHPNSQALADEALRIMRMSPKWNPGKMNGRPVRVQMIMPIRFVI